MRNACPGTACPHWVGPVCGCPPHDPPDVHILAEVTEPDDWARLDRAYARTNGVDHPPGILPPGYQGIES